MKMLAKETAIFVSIAVPCAFKKVIFALIMERGFFKDKRKNIFKVEGRYGWLFRWIVSYLFCIQ